MADPAVSGLILLGSVNKQEHDAFSDLDLLCIVKTTSDVKDVETRLIEAHGDRVRFNCTLESPTKLVIFIDDEQLHKVEFFLVLGLDDVMQYLAEADFSSTVLVDKDTSLHARMLVLKENHAASNQILTDDIVNREIDKILYGFDAFSLAHKRGDTYKAYFQYNLILHRLVRLVHISRGKTHDLHLPPNIVSDKYWPSTRIIQFKLLQGSLDLQAQDGIKQHFIQFFSQLLLNFSKNYRLRRSPDSILAFLKAVRDRDAHVDA